MDGLTPLIGTQAFLPALLAHIRAATVVSGSHGSPISNPACLPLDTVIFQSILLCLIAKDKHLILRTPEEDVGLAVKLAVWTLSTIFNLQTQKIKLRPSVPPTRQHHRHTPSNSSSKAKPKSKQRKPRSSTPTPSNGHWASDDALEPERDPTQPFLRSLFVPSPTNSSQQEEIHQQHHLTRPHTSHGHGHSNSYPHHQQGRQSNNPRLSGAGLSKTKPIAAPISRHPRSSSFPNSLSTHGHDLDLDEEDIIGTRDGVLMYAEPITSTPTVTSSTSTSTTSILKPTAVYAFNPHPSAQGHGRGHPKLPHAYTDPFPLSPPSPQSMYTKKRSHSRLQTHPELNFDPNEPGMLPQALVFSGLEEAPEVVQRCLAGVLGDGKILLDLREHSVEDKEWTMPDGFIAVYVCPWNATDRPGIHKTLLDKFAMSTNVFIPQNIRTEFQLLPFSASLSQLHTFFPHSNPYSRSNPNSPSAPHHVPLPSHTPPIYTKPLPGSNPSTTMHHYQQQYAYPYPQRSSTSASASSSSPPMSSPIPVPMTMSPSSTSSAGPTQAPSEPLIPPALIPLLRSFHTQTHLSPRLDLYLSDLLSAARHNSLLGGGKNGGVGMLGVRAMRDARSLVRSWRVLGGDHAGPESARQDLADDDDESDEDNAEEDDAYDDYDADRHANRVNNARSKASPPRVLKLDISEVDIARIIPRVVSHRVGLRVGPQDEVLGSLVFGATFGSGGDSPFSSWGEKAGKGVDEDDRREDEEEESVPLFDSVKSVLVSLLSEV